jgi:flavorubredoxin
MKGGTILKSVVVYASRSGNTRRVAEEIARALGERGEVELYEVADAPDRLPSADLLIVGGPTEGHSVTPPMVEFLERVDRASVADRAAVAFDTRLAWPRILSGSAAEGIAKRLRNAGARIVVDPESFIVDTKPELKPGELERAGSWARDVIGRLGVRAPVAA